MATGGYSDLGRGQDETFDYLCSICNSHGKDVEAEKFCIQCQDYYCSRCVKIHEQVSGLKYHKILDKSQFPLGSSVLLPAVPSETCKHHGHKPVDMYCESHDRVGCSTCMVIDHSECQKKFYIPEYIKNTKAVKPTDISAHLKTTQNSIQELLKALNGDNNNLRTSKDALRGQIKQLRKEINCRLDELEKNTMKRAELTVQSVLDSVDSMVNKLQHLVSEIKSTQDSLQAVAGNQAQLFVSMKKARDIISRATEIFQTTTEARSLPTISFSADQKLQSFLQEMEVLGSINLIDTIQGHANNQNVSLCPNKSPTGNKNSDIKISESISLSETTHDQATDQGVSVKPELPSAKKKQLTNSKNTCSEQIAEVMRSQPKTDQQKLMSPPLQIKDKKTYPVKVSKDINACNISSVCVLENGAVVLCDTDNNKLKYLDSFLYTVKDCYDVPESPWQVCAISEHKVAVTCTDSKLIQFVNVRGTMSNAGYKRIQFVNVKGTMSNAGQIHTGFCCRGLAYANRKLYVSDLGTVVYVYTISGQTLKQFKQHQYEPTIFCEPHMFCGIYSLAVSCDSSRIYVADSVKGLIILNNEGKLFAHNQCRQLDRTRNVCLCKNDSVFVCGYSSWNVLRFTSDGQLLGEVLKTDKRCNAVGWDEKKSKLVVSSLCENSIEIYDIQ